MVYNDLMLYLSSITIDHWPGLVPVPHIELFYLSKYEILMWCETFSPVVFKACPSSGYCRKLIRDSIKMKWKWKTADFPVQFCSTVFPSHGPKPLKRMWKVFFQNEEDQGHKISGSANAFSNVVPFRVISINAVWKFLRLGNSNREFFVVVGGWGGVLIFGPGIIWRFNFCPHSVIPVTWNPKYPSWGFPSSLEAPTAF